MRAWKAFKMRMPIRGNGLWPSPDGQVFYRD